jgi:hypothetical protein
VRALIVIVAVLAVCASCAGSSEVSGDRRVVGGVSMTFTVRPARVEVGKTVIFTLRMNNIAGRPAELTFPTGKQYDFWVTRGSREVWRWSDDRLFTQAVEKRTIGPQDTLSLSESWVAKDAGHFVVHGQLHADGYGGDLEGELDVGR